MAVKASWVPVLPPKPAGLGAGVGARAPTPNPGVPPLGCPRRGGAAVALP